MSVSLQLMFALLVSRISVTALILPSAKAWWRVDFIRKIKMGVEKTTKLDRDVNKNSELYGRILK